MGDSVLDLVARVVGDADDGLAQTVLDQPQDGGERYSEYLQLEAAGSDMITQLILEWRSQVLTGYLTRQMTGRVVG